MKAYQDMNQDELKTLHQQLSKQYQDKYAAEYAAKRRSVKSTKKED